MLALTACAKPDDKPATAKEVASKMGMGINLGNTFDRPIQPSDAHSVKQQITLFAEAGFPNVRIPVTWGDASMDQLIDEEGRLLKSSPRLQSLIQAVDHAIELDLFVIINMHHEDWLKQNITQTDTKLTQRFATAWQEIATLFADYDHRLMFEVLNEPDGAMGEVGTDVLPTDLAAQALTRKINLIGYEAIRSVPGNETRIVLVAPNGMGNYAMAPVIYPTPDSLPGAGKDPYLMITLHTYDPWDFCGEDGNNSVFLDEAKPFEALQEKLDAIVEATAEWAKSMPVGIHWGEFGVGRRNGEQRDHDIVRLYYSYFPKKILEKNWGGTVWDDRGWYGISKTVSEIQPGDSSWHYGLDKALLGSQKDSSED
ncbi:MAG: cellulase family glycosylhydrolase [Pseudomonadota bacterium]